MGVLEVELGIPYTGWPLRLNDDYEFGLDIVSSALRDQLVSWAADFNEHFDEGAGWSSEGARLAHAKAGEDLRSLLQSDLGPNFRVVLNELGSGMSPAGPL